LNYFTLTNEHTCAYNSTVHVSKVLWNINELFYLDS